jgi:hypothetical protein
MFLAALFIIAKLIESAEVPNNQQMNKGNSTHTHTHTHTHTMGYYSAIKKKTCHMQENGWKWRTSY